MASLLAAIIVCAADEPSDARRRVAVLGFENLRKDSETDWVGAVTAETLTTKLAGVKAMLVIERAQVNKVIGEQRFQQSNLVDPETAIKAGQMLGAQSVVVGSFAVARQRVLFNARVIDVQTAEVLHAATLGGSEDTVMDLPLQLADAVIESLSKKVVVVEGRKHLQEGTPPRLSEEERTRLARRPTDKAAAYRAYGRGVDLDNKHRWKEAQAEFQRAVELDPTFAKAWMELGRMHDNQGVWEKALQCCMKARALFQEKGSESDMAWVLNGLGVLHSNMGNPAEAMKCYQGSLAISQRLGNEADVAQTLTNIGSAHCAEGRFAEAAKCFSAALALCRKVDDQPGAALALINLGGVHGQEERFAEAMKCFSESLAISRKLGDEPGMAPTLGNIANAQAALGRYPEAIQTYEQALALYRKLGSEPDVAQTLYNMAAAYDRGMGQPGKALSLAREGAQLARKLKLPDAVDYDDLVKILQGKATR